MKKNIYIINIKVILSHKNVLKLFKVHCHWHCLFLTQGKKKGTLSLLIKKDCFYMFFSFIFFFAVALTQVKVAKKSKNLSGWCQTARVGSDFSFRRYIQAQSSVVLFTLLPLTNIVRNILKQKG